MKQLSNSNIVIIPTKDEPTLGSLLYREAFEDISLWRFKESYTYGDGTKVYRTLGSSFEDWYKGMKHYHMYIISNSRSALKENDYFLWFSYLRGEYQVHQFDYDRGYGIQTKTPSGDGFLIVNHSGNVGKVYYTTDTSLRISDPCIQCDGTGETTFSGTYTTQKKCDVCSQVKYPNTKTLPQPSEEIINKFVEEYNKEFRKPVTFKYSSEKDPYKEKFRLALLQLKDYSDNELIIQEGVTLNINEELSNLL